MKKLHIIILGFAILIIVLGAIEINNAPFNPPLECSTLSCDPSQHANPCIVTCMVGEVEKHLFGVGQDLGYSEACCGSWTDYFCHE